MGTFAKVKIPGSRKINFEQFKQALMLFCQKEGLTYSYYSNKVIANG